MIGAGGGGIQGCLGDGWARFRALATFLQERPLICL